MTQCYSLLRFEAGRTLHVLLAEQPIDPHNTTAAKILWEFEDEGSTVLEDLTRDLLPYLRSSHDLVIEPPEIVIDPAAMRDPAFRNDLIEQSRDLEKSLASRTHELERRGHNKHTLVRAYRQIRQALASGRARPPQRQRTDKAFERMLQRARNICWGTDVDGYCISLNDEAWRHYTGYAAAQDRGDGWLRRIHPEDRSRAAANWQRAYTARVPIVDQYRLLHADGREIWIRCEGEPGFTPGGIFTGYTGQAFKIRAPKVEKRDIQSFRPGRVQPIRATA